MHEVEFSHADIQENRVWAALGYLVFFIPLIKCKNSPLGRFCANQGLLLLIVEVIVGLLFSIFGGLPLIGWLFRFAGKLVGLAIALYGLLLCAQLLAKDRAFELPFIGHINLIR